MSPFRFWPAPYNGLTTRDRKRERRVKERSVEFVHSAGVLIREEEYAGPSDPIVLDVGLLAALFEAYVEGWLSSAVEVDG
jgi:hypothetical protein